MVYSNLKIIINCNFFFIKILNDTIAKIDKEKYVREIIYKQTRTKIYVWLKIRKDTYNQMTVDMNAIFFLLFITFFTIILNWMPWDEQQQPPREMLEVLGRWVVRLMGFAIFKYKFQWFSQWFFLLIGSAFYELVLFVLLVYCGSYCIKKNFHTRMCRQV